jgi:DNA-directed RNA polymerase subunit RPC12/RpoP
VPLKGVVIMVSKCPGQDMRKLRVELYKCPTCGAEVEIFSDETRIRCQKCGTMVFKERLPSCIEWCASARQCLGEERWKQIMGEDKSEPVKKQVEEGKK